MSTPNSIKFFNAIAEYNQINNELNKLDSINHPLTVRYLADVQNFLGHTIESLADKLTLVDEGRLPEYVIAKYGKVSISHLHWAYLKAISDKRHKLYSRFLKAKVEIYHLQNSLPIDYFRGNEDIFIMVQEPTYSLQNFRLDTAFRQLLKLGQAKVWECYDADGAVKLRAVSFPIDPSKLQEFYFCYYSYIFNATCPSDVSVDWWCRYCFELEYWQNSEQVRNLFNFIDVTDSYFYVS